MRIKMKYIHLLGLSSLLLFGSCKSYLDLVPEKDIKTVKSIFERRETVLEWVFTAYSYIAKAGSCVLNPAITGADELVAGPYLRQPLYPEMYDFQGLYIGDGLQMSQAPHANIWDNGYYEAIRYCNDFFTHIGDTYNMSDSEKREFTASMKALKAFIYFELVRHYGPIVLVPENIGTQAPIEEMYVPRSHVDTCFKEIVRLLDEAAEDIAPNANKPAQFKAYFTKEAVLALKARALFYQASPLFNGNDYYVNFKDEDGKALFSTTYDPERWKTAAMAADAAVAFCEGQGRKLTSLKGLNNRATPLLNVMLDIENSVLPLGWDDKECIFGIKYNHTFAKMYRFTLPEVKEKSLFGGLAPSIKMVEMYYTENGLPINADKDWDYSIRYNQGREYDARYLNVLPTNETSASVEKNVLNLHLRREPRFYACIAADRCYWMRGTGTANNIQMKCYKGEANGSKYATMQIDNGQNMSGYYLKKFTHSNMALSDLTAYAASHEAQGDHPFPIIRLAELYLIQAEAWNEYEGPKANRAHVYDPLNKIRERADIPDVETSWHIYSTSPGKVDTKEGMREIIRQEWNIEFAFEGYRFWNLRRWKTAHEVLNEKLYGWNVLGESAQSFYNNFQGPIVVWSKRKFEAPRDYLFPIRSEEVMVAGLKQNLNW